MKRPARERAQPHPIHNGSQTGLNFNPGESRKLQAEGDLVRHRPGYEPSGGFLEDGSHLLCERPG